MKTLDAGVDEERGFELKVHLQDSGDYELELVLRQKALEQAAIFDPDFKAPTAPIVLARYAVEYKLLYTFPITTNFNTYFLRPKYGGVKSIVFENVRPLEEFFVPDELLYFEFLPAGVIRLPFAGFGLNHDMRYILNAARAQGQFDELVLTVDDDMRFMGSSFLLPYDVFDTYRRAVNRTHARALAIASKAKSEYLDINFKLALDPNYELPSSDGTRKTVAELLVETLTGRSRSSAEATTAAVRTVRQSMKTMAEKDPVELMDLHREIELVTLDELIERISTKIAQPTLTESHWQEFLTANAFVLQLAFNLPAIIFDDQVSVGGTRFDGRGGKLADYVLRLGNLGNLAIIEIKRPKTELVETRQYREGMHAPTRELVGAVNQVLDQRYNLQLDINSKKVASRIFDVYTYAVPCIVIAGVLPVSPSEQKSFELYRHNQRDVVIITFDELLAKLRALLDFLKNPPPAIDPGSNILEDDPF